MHRNWLLEKLGFYPARDADDAANRDRIGAFVEEHPRCFERALLIGHITGSGWLMDHTGQRVLLTHHAKLNKWLQLGGHADGDSNVLRVALREAAEESGLNDIIAVSDEIFDLDVHPIPARGGEPEHFHYDVRFLLQATGDDRHVRTDESHELRWFTAAELADFTVGRSVHRMREKWLAHLNGTP
ncbi:MAG: NUDIX hydrolase [Planctomycetes bacterium]|nr:NUDIX hydrolase [Planctomycetota bacterium]